MANMIVVGTLTWFHIFSVLGWTGAALTFLITIKPTLAKFSPQASGEFILKVMPRFTRSVQILSALTLTFGPLLAYAMNDGPPNQFNLISPWSICINWNNRFTRSFPIAHTNSKQINTHHTTNAEEPSTAAAS